MSTLARKNTPAKSTAVVRRAPAAATVRRAPTLTLAASPDVIRTYLRPSKGDGVWATNLCPLCHGHSPDRAPRACVPDARLEGEAEGGSRIRCSLDGVHLHRSCQHCAFLWTVGFYVEPARG